MKSTILFLLLLLGCIFHIHAQSVNASEVPEPAVSAFKQSQPNLPSHISPAWYLEKNTSEPSMVLYKVSYMEGTFFQTFCYNQHGGLIYQNTDWYHQNQAPQTAMDAISQRYNQGMQRISRFESEKYKLSGYVIRFSDKSRYFTLEGEDRSGSPQKDILNAAFADPTNFTTSTAPATGSPASGKGSLKPKATPIGNQ